jgi:hypothetical protein
LTPNGLPDLAAYLPAPGELINKATEAYKRDHNGQAADIVTELAPYLKKLLEGAR